MTKLLSAGFARLRRDKYFWTGIIVMFLYAVFCCVFSYINMKKSGSIDHLDNYFFNYTVFSGILTAVYCSMFIGTEYSEGTIRNKLIVGHTRTAIYLSNLAVCSVSCLLMMLSYIAGALLAGIPLLGNFKAGPAMILAFAGCSLLMVLAYVGILTLLAMLNSNKAANAVVSILLVLVLLWGASSIDVRLAEPEMENFFTWSVGGEDGELPEDLEDLQERPNPRYLSGTKREIYQFAYDFLPSGQTLQILQSSGEHIARWPFCSAGILIVSTAAGIFLFRKKDLK